MYTQVAVWRSGSTLVSINVVALHRDRLVLGWVTESSNFVCTILAFSVPLSTTQPGHPYVGRQE